MPTAKSNAEDVALSLTLAVVSSSPGPLLLLDGQLKVIAASLSFCEAFEASQADLTGQALSDLGDGRWDIPKLHALLAAAAAGEALAGPVEFDVDLPGRPNRRVIAEASRLAYLDLAQTRILVAASDVTDARADAALNQAALHQSKLFLQEVRHRIANSLQIIASVLLQNARKTTSDETRSHLKDAHHRVMSVAELERLLSTSPADDVEVGAYFTSLCDCISALMIANGDSVSLTVEGGGGVVGARLSLSLGLIVTELVINALKHAFPDGRPGNVTVDYDFHGANWIVCVRDDGVGMPPPGTAARTGLGTTIVQALAAQLNASIDVVPQYPGLKTSITHAPIALVQHKPETARQPLVAAPPTPSANIG